MKNVYLLWHSYKKNEVDDEDKMLGVFATKEDAQATIEIVGDQPGFRDHPDGFQISEYELGRICWAEGFGWV